MKPATVEVSTVVGGYRVMLHGELHVVNKRRACSCGRPHCAAIKAVAAYLKAGGQRAPEAKEPPKLAGLTCPICDAPAQGSLQLKDWHCTVDRSHYFEWRVQRIRVARAKALQGASPYVHEVLSAFASNEARARFLAAHPLTYPAGA
jgi:hypothetical protein